MPQKSPNTVKRLNAGRIECTVIFMEEECKTAEERALKALACDVQMDGFRKGNVPIELVRERVNPGKLFEETVRELLPETFGKLIAEHGIKPVIHPKVEVQDPTPLTILITFVEKPVVKVKGAEKIRIDRKEIAVDPAELDRMIDFIVEKQRKNGETEKPKLTDEFAQNKLGAKSADDFRTKVQQSMLQQEERIERMRRERALLDAITEATVVDLAPELIEEESKSMSEEFLEQLKIHNVTLEQWMEKTRKTADDLRKEITEQSEKRLRLRLGIARLIEEKGVAASDETTWQAEVEKMIREMLAA